MKMIIGGKWVDKQEKIDVTNPYDGKVINTVPKGTAEDVDHHSQATALGASDRVEPCDAVRVRGWVPFLIQPPI